ncbi:claudin-8-like isoform X2 [Astyanax mexicanus]|uniref:Claudin-8-like n=2 Tax=Astyanax mexicanus TaxID=7994 RepID=A0A8B9H5U7_ASTMX|nr:claudin-8-like isoform X2 [Astyanax mexicanus]KAG9265228.1 claudin-8-like [Astyanax mexicanus]
MSYTAGSYVDKSYGGQSYLGKSLPGSAYTGYDDQTAKTLYEEQLQMEKKKRREGMHCEVVALVIAFVGLVGVAAVTGLPMWKVTAFIQENIIVMETRWEGLWMNCFRQANIRMQCKVYDSLLYLPAELQAARGLMCSAVALAAIGFIVASVGMRCTRLVDSRPRVKHVVLVTGGCLFLAACLATIIPVSWTAHVIIQDFYNPLLLDAQRRELGEALYIGWVTSALLFIAGVILLCRHAPRTQDKEDISVLYRPGSAPYTYKPGYTYQPAYTYQPGYSYQPAYTGPPPPGSVAYSRPAY